MTNPFPAMEIRPYHPMEIISRIGEGRGDDLGDARLNHILRTVRRNPALPLVLRCNVASCYSFQNPGVGEDTPEGALFNLRRDLKILQLLGLAPGAVRPAIDLFEHVLEAIPSAQGIFWFAESTGEAWRGTPRAACHYEEGRALGIAAIIPGRSQEEMEQAKAASTRRLSEADTLDIRPHHLMCMTCFHGGKETLAPIAADNLFEAIDRVQKNPDIPVRLVCGPCMICPPCPHLRPEEDHCIGGHGMALRDELKDLEVLQRLGMQYDDTMPARKLLGLLYERVPSAKDVCGYGDGVVRSREWSICGGEAVNERYEKGRAAGLGML